MVKTKTRHTSVKITKYLLLTIFSLLTFIPFLFALFTSLKSIPQFAHNYWTISFPIHWQNYVNAGRIVINYIGNSLFVTTISVIGILCFSVLTAYVFGRYHFPGKSILFYLIIMLLMVPGVLTLIPAFILMKNLHLLNSRWALIFSYISGGQVISIFILRTFIESIPEDLFSAARIDGTNHFQILRYIVVPLTKPVIGTVAILNILGIWNDYIWPLVVLHDDRLRTITIGLKHFTDTASYGNIDYGGLMAGYLIGAIPLVILFMFTMRQFIEGLTAGALKG